ncbi:MAG: amine oxidase [Methylovulum sp.]
MNKPLITKEQNNADSIARFVQYIAEQKPLLKKQYEQLLAHDLSRQQWDGCFQRNVLAVLEQAYDEALAYIKTLPFDSSTSMVNRGLSDLTKQLLAAFDGFVDDFLLFVVDKHRISCALSNFPGEHKPDNAYVNEVRHGVAELWQNFALTVNAYILECR